MRTRADRQARMAAAASRTAPDAVPVGQTAIRTRPVRVTVRAGGHAAAFADFGQRS